jgi:hypothetical protein
MPANTNEAIKEVHAESTNRILSRRRPFPADFLYANADSLSFSRFCFEV